MSWYSNDSARPREISSRSAKVNILRTMSILTHRTQDHMLRPAELTDYWVDPFVREASNNRGNHGPITVGTPDHRIVSADRRGRRCGRSIECYSNFPDVIDNVAWVGQTDSAAGSRFRTSCTRQRIRTFATLPPSAPMPRQADPGQITTALESIDS
jgi:hypothetical protein